MPLFVSKKKFFKNFFKIEKYSTKVKSLVLYIDNETSYLKFFQVQLILAEYNVSQYPVQRCTVGYSAHQFPI